MAPIKHEYIPLGCIIISHGENENFTASYEQLALDAGNGAQQCEWLPLPSDADDSARPALNKLLKASPTPNLQRLFDSGWIRLEYLTVGVETRHTILRVYVLPDDIARGTIDREDAALRKTRRLLFQRLDYSSEIWAGRIESPSQDLTETFLPAETGEAPSLLELFNTINAPNPNPSDADDDALQSIMRTVLEGEIEGVTSRLYPYQRRSVAAMAMREVQPGRFLDPRLLSAKDQHRNTFFIDPKTLAILRESRSYDGVRGGILAEQMGAGKTLMCLSLILATQPLPTPPPPHRELVREKVRRGARSLVDMAAASANSHGLPCAWHFGALPVSSGCLEALQRNPGRYEVPEEPRPAARPSRHVSTPAIAESTRAPTVIHLSQTSFIAMPQNLLQQWQHEIAKHTTGLKIFVVEKKVGVPEPVLLAEYDVVLCTHNLLEWMVRDDPTRPFGNHNITKIHFKRLIVDEGHRLGNSRINTMSDFHRGLDSLHATSRWIVTGTPSKGLYGVENLHSDPEKDARKAKKSKPLTVQEQETRDIQKIGAIAKLYLKARPWANSAAEGEEPADWAAYVLQGAYGHGKHGALRGALNSLIIRHPLSELSHMYPTIEEKVVVLEGSFQDKLALDLFSATIIFNAVQSQRTDVDYFFHPRQRKALMEAVHNLQQASFFGGVFFSPDNLTQALTTATKFLEDKKIPIGEEDTALMHSAIGVAEVALGNLVRTLSSEHHEVPILVQDFLPEAAGAWCFDIGQVQLGCTISPLVVAAQKLIRASLNDETKFNSLLNGGLIEEGKAIKKAATAGNDDKTAVPNESSKATMAGNTRVGEDKHPEARKKAQEINIEGDFNEDAEAEARLPESFKKAQLVATASAKVSYLLDGIAEHQAEEQIIIFYDNENMAYYIAGMLEVMHVHHLIYAKSLTAQRKALYVDTFNSNDKFRVMLMDIGQAAFGLDMRAASRIYFTSPVLNPQVQAQAIGRARRISQKKPVTVETLVLRGSMEEVIVQRKSKMSQAEHWKVRTILDDAPIYDWISDAKVRFDTDATTGPLEQFAFLKHPQPVFATGFGHQVHPDAGLLGHADKGREARPLADQASQNSAQTPTKGVGRQEASAERVLPLDLEPSVGASTEPPPGSPLKRKLKDSGGAGETGAQEDSGQAPRRVRFA